MPIFAIQKKTIKTFNYGKTSQKPNDKKLQNNRYS